MLEQDTARELITEASKKLTDALQHKGQENMQSVKVAQLMLSAGNYKLNAAKQLADIKLQKEKLQEQLHKQQQTAKKAEGGTTTVSAPPATRSKLQ